jgi:hypothetical protein
MTITWTMATRLSNPLNHSRCWQDRKNITKNQRTAARFIAAEALQRAKFNFLAIPKLRITMTRTGPKEMDWDGNVASLKHVQDGIADCLGLNDKDKRIAWVAKQRTGPGVKYGVEIELTEV